jgi:hypothetical protein
MVGKVFQSYFINRQVNTGLVIVIIVTARNTRKKMFLFISHNIYKV